MRVWTVVLLGLLCVTPFAGAQDAVTSLAPLLSIEKVDQLPSGTPLYGFSTLDLTGPKKFNGRLLGVLYDSNGPGLHVIAVELDGDFFKSSGIIAGQSGSPVFVDVDGKPHKIGTLSFGYGWQKNPIGFLTPIADVLASEHSGSPAFKALQASNGTERVHSFMERFSNDPGVRLLRSLDSISSGASVSGTNQPVTPGSVLGVQLAWGDYDLTAHGTVSHVDGEKIFMFGHPFLQLGQVEYRLIRSRVLTVQQGYKSSFIMAAPIRGAKPVGVITQDRATGISGILGQEPKSAIPVTVHAVMGARENTISYETVSDPKIGPVLIALGVDSVITTSLRQIGDVTIFMSGSIELTNGLEIQLDEAFFDGTGPVMSILRKTQMILDNEFSAAKIKQVTVSLRMFEETRKLSIESATLAQSNIKSGDTLSLHVTLSQPLHDPRTLTWEIPIPEHLRPGVGKIIVADADTLNTTEREDGNVVNLTTLVESLNHVRPSDIVYVYVVLPPSAVDQEKAKLGKQPLKFGDTTINVQEISKRLSANVVEYRIPMSDFLVSGSKTLEFKVGIPLDFSAIPVH